MLACTNVDHSCTSSRKDNIARHAKKQYGRGLNYGIKVWQSTRTSIRNESSTAKEQQVRLDPTQQPAFDGRASASTISWKPDPPFPRLSFYCDDEVFIEEILQPEHAISMLEEDPNEPCWNTGEPSDLVLSGPKPRWDSSPAVDATIGMFELHEQTRYQIQNDVSGGCESFLNFEEATVDHPEPLLRRGNGVSSTSGGGCNNDTNTVLAKQYVQAHLHESSISLDPAHPDYFNAAAVCIAARSELLLDSTNTVDDWDSRTPVGDDCSSYMISGSSMVGKGASFSCEDGMPVSHWNEVKQQRNAACARLWRYFLDIYYSTSNLSAVAELLCCADVGSNAVSKVDPPSAPLSICGIDPSTSSVYLSENGTIVPVCDTEICISEGEVSFMQATHADDPERTPLMHILLPQRILMEQAMADKVTLSYLIDISEFMTSIQSYATASGPSRGSGHAADNASTLGNYPSSARPTLLKRTRTERERDEDDCDDQGRRNKRSKHDSLPPEQRNTKTLACPYSKRYPHKYSSFKASNNQYRNCSSGYWTTISRLKQHLYRVHRRPEHYCPRCFKDFSSEELLETHALRICVLTVSPYSEKMNKDQLSQIKRRNPKIELTKGWYEIYQILFPGEALPESPFPDDPSSVLLQRYESLYLQKAPRQLTAIIGSRLGLQMACTSIQPELLQSVLKDSVSQLVQALSRDFRHQDTTDNNSSIDDLENLQSSVSETSHYHHSICSNLSFQDTTSTHITNPEGALSTFSSLHQPDQAQIYDNRIVDTSTWHTYSPNLTSLSQTATSATLNDFHTALGDAIYPLPNLSSTSSLPHHASNDPDLDLTPWVSEPPQTTDAELFEAMLVDDVGDVVPD